MPLGWAKEIPARGACVAAAGATWRVSVRHLLTCLTRAARLEEKLEAKVKKAERKDGDLEDLAEKELGKATERRLATTGRTSRRAKAKATKVVALIVGSLATREEKRHAGWLRRRFQWTAVWSVRRQPKTYRLLNLVEAQCGRLQPWPSK